MAGSLSRCWRRRRAARRATACTTPIESSTVTNCSPAACTSLSVRPRHGRISACSPVTRCARLSFVATCTVRRQRGSASAVYSVSGVAQRKLPPSAEEDLDLALVHRLDRRRPCRRPCCARRLEAELRCRARRRNAVAQASPRCPSVRSPCTLLCPRTGQTPAPGLPICPRRSSKLTISWTLATRVLVLREAHRPAADHALSTAMRDLGGLADLLARDAAALRRSSSQVVASRSASERLEAVACARAMKARSSTLPPAARVSSSSISFMSP